MKSRIGLPALGLLVCAASLRAQAGADLVLFPGAATVMTGHTIHLSVKRIAPDGTIEDLAGSQTAVAKASWMLDGAAQAASPANGTLRGLLFDAEYQAPIQVPNRNPVAVAVAIQPKPGDPRQITLVCNVTVVQSSNFFSLSGGGTAQLFRLHDRYSSAATRSALARGVSAGPLLNVTVNGMQPAGGGETQHSSGTMVLNIGGTSVGAHAWSITGTTPSTVTLIVGTSSGMDLYNNADCLPHGTPNCEPRSTDGTTRMLKIDPATRVAEGEFEGTLVRVVNGKPANYVSVTGNFQVNLTAVP